MSSDRIRVTESSRAKLHDLERDGETYSDALDRVLPDEPGDDEILYAQDKVSISVTPEIHQRVNALAGENVPVHRVIEFYLYRREVEQMNPPDVLLDRLYNRGNEHGE